jgi:hypothetical protein
MTSSGVIPCALGKNDVDIELLVLYVLGTFKERYAKNSFRIRNPLDFLEIDIPT